MVLLRPVAFGIDEQVTPVAPCFSDRTPGVALKNMAELHDRESVESSSLLVVLFTCRGSGSTSSIRYTRSRMKCRMGPGSESGKP